MAKRKREETASGKSSKKVAFDAPPNKTKVSSLLQAKNSPPVIGTSQLLGNFAGHRDC